MILFEIHQKFKGHFLNELRVFFKNIKSFSSLEHGPKSNKSALAFLKLCFQLC